MVRRFRAHQFMRCAACETKWQQKKQREMNPLIHDMRMLESRFCIDCISLCPMNVADQTTWLRLPRLLHHHQRLREGGSEAKGTQNDQGPTHSYTPSSDVGVHLTVATGKPEESQPAASQSSPLILGTDTTRARPSPDPPRHRLVWKLRAHGFICLDSMCTYVCTYPGSSAYVHSFPCSLIPGVSWEFDGPRLPRPLHEGSS